jgi:hypothetical protein
MDIGLKERSMINDPVLIVLQACAFGLPAFHGLFTGVRCLVARKPFFVRNWWFEAMFVLFFACNIRDWMLDFLYIRPTIPAYAWFCLATLGFLALYLTWRLFTSRSYMACACTAEWFQETVCSSLEKLNLPFERTSKGIRLLSLGADIRISSPEYFSALSTNKRQSKSLLDEIVKTMESESRDALQSAVSRKGWATMVIGGILMLGLGTYLVYSRVTFVPPPPAYPEIRSIGAGQVSHCRSGYGIISDGYRFLS